MGTTAYLLLAVLVCAAGTFLIRLAPFALFGGKREMPPAVRRLARRMPAAIVAVLVVYSLKGLSGSDAAHVAASLTGVLAVVLLHLWKKNTLVSIAGGTILYMLLLRAIGGGL